MNAPAPLHSEAIDAAPVPLPAHLPIVLPADPEQHHALERYAGMLAGPGVVRGLLGPHEADRVWERHLLNCVALATAVDPGQTVLDLGSGAGLPGVVLAVLRPDVTVVLLEPLLRRASFLEQVVQDLGLRATVVRRDRAEQLAGKVLVDVVTARAVAPLPRLAGWALPLLHPGGRLLAQKGDRASEELASTRPQLAALGASQGSLLDLGAGPTLTRVVVLTRAEDAGRQRPRPRPAP